MDKGSSQGALYWLDETGNENLNISYLADNIAPSLQSTHRASKSK